MVRSAHSLAVAISTRRASTGWSIRRSAARSARTSARRAAAIATAFTRATVARAAVGTFAPWPGRSLAIFTVPLAAHDDFAATNHLAVHTLDNARCIRGRDFHEGVALAQIDLADVIAGNSAFAGNRAYEVADLDTIACSNRHEEAGHSGCGGASAT
jgi:hypothetical protein